MAKKYREFAYSCVSCSAANSLTQRKMSLGRFAIPTHAFSTIFCDLWEGIKGSSVGYTAVLIVVCALTNFVCYFPLKKATSEGVLTALQSFLGVTGHATKILRSDNASIFRSKTFLTQMAMWKIRVAESSVFRSQARGRVEVQVKLLQRLLSKLLLLSPRTDWSNLLSLANAVLNNSHIPSIGCCPAQAIYGHRTIDLGPFGTGQEKSPINARILTPDLQKDVEKLHENIQNRLRDIQIRIREEREKIDAEENKKKESHDFRVGDVVFVRFFGRRLGEYVKLRPKVNLSPCVVLNAKSRAITVRRIADSFTSVYYPGDLRHFRERSELFRDLPNAVAKIVGRDMNENDFLELARLDKLEPVYRVTDEIDSSPFFQPSAPKTRNAKKAEKRRQAEHALIASEFADESDIDSDDGEDQQLEGKKNIDQEEVEIRSVSSDDEANDEDEGKAKSKRVRFA